MRKTILASAVAFTLLAGTTATANGVIESTATAPTIRLGAAVNEALAGTIADDSTINLGGFGSDLYRMPLTTDGTYWALTDRGPNNDVVVNGADVKGFPVKDFTPLIMQLQVSGSTVSIKQKIAVVGTSGKPVGGLPNVAGYDDPGADAAGTALLPFNVNGLDLEGLVRMKDGSFWAVDEYGPSLLHISAKGVVLKRFVPAGWKGTGTDYPVEASLPGIFLKRKVNRGFEGLALTPDEKSLFIALQSPLLNPDKATGNASLATRLLKFDIPSQKVVAEYPYTFESLAIVDPTVTKVSELKVSAIVALNANTLLVQERTDNSFIVTRIQPTEENNILGTDLDNVDTKPSLEAYPTSVAKTLGTKVVSKRTIFRSVGVAGMPGKVEGMAVIDAKHIAFINDNDFSFTYDAKLGTVVPGTVPTQIVTVALTEALPTTPDANVRAAAASVKAAVAKAGASCSKVGAVASKLVCKRNATTGKLVWTKR